MRGSCAFGVTSVLNSGVSRASLLTTAALIIGGSGSAFAQSAGGVSATASSGNNSELHGRFSAVTPLQLVKDSHFSPTSTPEGIILVGATPAIRKVRPIAAVMQASAAASTPAGAQDEAAGGEGGIADIVVTAQKREERLQDTPISIVAFGSEALADRGINSLPDLFTGAIPSLRVAPFGARTSATIVGMRGIVPTSAEQISRDATVGIYIDGIYLGRSQGLGMELADVERIEVLRGPQGTLFGRNAVGGAISMVTKRPSGKFDIDAKLGVSNRDGRTAFMHINLPAVANVSVKLDGVYNSRDGWVANTLPGFYDYGRVKRYGFRAAALWEPTDTISVQYAYDWSRDKSTANYSHLTGRTSATAPPLPPAFVIDQGRAKFSRIAAPTFPSVARASGHSLTAEWEATDNLTIRSISGWRKLDQDQQDQDTGMVSVFIPAGSVGRLSFSNVKQHQYSQELQFVGELGDVKYVAGAYYFDEDARDTATAFTTNTWDATGTATTVRVPFTSGRVPDRASVVEAKSRALFGQATWSPSALDGRLHLTGGLRYTHDTKSGRLTAIRGVDPNLAFSFRSKRVDPMVTIAYDLSDDVNSYVKYSQAYRAGGANSRSAILRTFEEEVLKSWEAGLKADLLDRHLRLNIALFISRLIKPQVEFPDSVNISASETLNGNRPDKIKGAEVDVTVAPTRELMLTASYAFTDAKRGVQTNPFSAAQEIIQTSYTPRHAATLALDYTFPPVPVGALKAHVDMNWSSGYYSFVLPSIDSTLSNRTIMLNGRLTFADIPLGEGELEFALWGRNLTNRTIQLSDSKIPSVGNIISVFNEPRTYGLEARMRF